MAHLVSESCCPHQANLQNTRGHEEKPNAQTRNPVARHAPKFNKPARHRLRTRYQRKRRDNDPLETQMKNLDCPYIVRIDD